MNYKIDSEYRHLNNKIRILSVIKYAITFIWNEIFKEKSKRCNFHVNPKDLRINYSLYINVLLNKYHQNLHEKLSELMKVEFRDIFSSQNSKFHQNSFT